MFERIVEQIVAASATDLEGVPSPCRQTPRWYTGGQARHEDHFLLEGGPVRVLCERRLKDL